MTGDPINVWRARHRETGLPRYLWGSYDDERQLYMRLLSDHERRQLDFAHEGIYYLRGSFGEIARYTNDRNARRRAFDMDGYSRIGNAVHNLGPSFVPWE